MTVCIDFTVVIVAYFLSAFCPAVVIASFLALFALLVASVAAVDIASCFALFALEVASAEAVLIAEVFASFAFLVASLAAVLIISCLIVVISVEETLLLISPSNTLNCDVTSFLYSVKAFSASSGAGDQSVALLPISPFKRQKYIFLFKKLSDKVKKTTIPSLFVVLSIGNVY